MGEKFTKRFGEGKEALIHLFFFRPFWFWGYWK
jgi:hypothetical protein